MAVIVVHDNSTSWYAGKQMDHDAEVSIIGDLIAAWSHGGRGSITITVGAMGGWDVTAARKVVHGYGDIGISMAAVESQVEAVAHMNGVLSEDNLEKAIAEAIKTCRTAIERWPLTRME
jgi:hypothetical protein